MAALLAGLVLTDLLTACGGREPTTTDFCRAVAHIPPGSTVEEAQASFAEVEAASPRDIRGTVARLRTAIDRARSEGVLDSMDETGSPLRPAALAFASYVSAH